MVEAGPECPECLEATLDTVVERHPSRSIVLRRTARAGPRGLGRGRRALPSPLGRPAAGLLRADRPPGRPRGARPPARGRPAAPGGEPAVRPLVDRGPSAEPSSLFLRPGRRVLAADPRPARPARPSPRPSGSGSTRRSTRSPATPPGSGSPAGASWSPSSSTAPTRSTSLSRIASVEILAQVPGDPKVPRLAAWLVAWLAGQLGWEPVERREPEPGRLEATFRSPKGEVAVAIRAEGLDPGGVARILGVTLATRRPRRPRHLSPRPARTRFAPGPGQRLLAPRLRLPRVVFSPAARRPRPRDRRPRIGPAGPPVRPGPAAPALAARGLVADGMIVLTRRAWRRSGRARRAGPRGRSRGRASRPST